MAIIYTYPTKATPITGDLILISDSADSNKTKQVTVGSLPFTNNPGTVTSVGLSMPSAFAVANTPVTNSDTIAVTTTGGNVGQFLAYDGTWGTPTGGAANPAGDPGQLQYNLNGSSFGASPNMVIGGGAAPNVLSVTNIIQARGDSTNTGKFKVYSSDNSSHVSIEGPPIGGADYSLKMPNAVGSADQVLKLPSTIGTTPYQLEWGAAGGSGPDGSDHDIQYKNGSAFAGTNDLRYHPTQNELSVKHTVIVKGQGSGNPSGILKLNCEQDSHAVTLEGPAHSGGTNYTLKFPSAAPANNEILQYTTAGNLGWISTPTGGPGTGTQYAIPFWSTTSALSDSILSQDALATKVVLAAAKKLEIPNDGTTSATAINFGTANTGINGYGTTSIGLVSGGQSRIEVTTGIGAGQDITLTGLTQSDGGLRFGNNGETLNSYEEGSWTPTMFGAGSPSVTATGQYVKIGRNVTVWFSLVCTAGNTFAVARISGLPFNGQPASAYGHNGGASISVNTGNSASVRYVTGTSGGATTLDLKVFTTSTITLNGPLPETENIDYQYSIGYWPNSQGNFTVRGTYTYKSQS